MHIGFDDIDTPYGGCTTHYTALFLKHIIEKKKLKLIDYPNLIRLNPGVPWKTRGNGSTVLRLSVEDYDTGIRVFEEAVSFLDNYLSEYRVDWGKYCEPSILAYFGEPDTIVTWFSRKALYDVIPRDLLNRVLNKISDRVKYYSEGGRGLTGSLAGVGYRMIDTDYTFELTCYREHDYIDKPRNIDLDSVVAMDKLYGDRMILNIDYETNRPLILSHGPDPILLGLRGEDPEILLKAYEKLLINEPVSIRIVYRTNQHTDAHLKTIKSLEEAYPYRSVRIRVNVSSKPFRGIGGHLFFKVSDGSREIDVAVYEPTGGLRRIAEKLLPGDVVEVMGVVRPFSIKHGYTINLEKLRVIWVKPYIVFENPICPRCGARMESMGRGKGFRCRKCGYRSRNLVKTVRIVRRDIEPGWYEPPPRAFKHLMKPLKRFGLEKESFPRTFSPENILWSRGVKII